jgi:hypothetical protein
VDTGLRKMYKKNGKVQDENEKENENENETKIKKKEIKV